MACLGAALAHGSRYLAAATACDSSSRIGNSNLWISLPLPLRGPVLPVIANENLTAHITHGGVWIRLACQVGALAGATKRCSFQDKLERRQAHAESSPPHRFGAVAR